jgi:TonB family protein
MCRILGVSLTIGMLFLPALAADPGPPTTPLAEVLRPTAEQWCSQGTESTPDNDCVTAPVMVSAVPPPYPELALKGRIVGQVEIEIVVDESGKVVGTKFLRQNKVFNDAALAAVTKRRYKPAFQRGVPVATAFPVIVKFDFAPPSANRAPGTTPASGGEVVTVTPYDSRSGPEARDQPPTRSCQPSTTSGLK